MESLRADVPEVVLTRCAEKAVTGTNCGIHLAKSTKESSFTSKQLGPSSWRSNRTIDGREIVGGIGVRKVREKARDRVFSPRKQCGSSWLHTRLCFAPACWNTAPKKQCIARQKSEDFQRNRTQSMWSILLLNNVFNNVRLSSFHLVLTHWKLERFHCSESIKTKTKGSKKHESQSGVVFCAHKSQCLLTEKENTASESWVIVPGLHKKLMTQSKEGN